RRMGRPCRWRPEGGAMAGGHTCFLRKLCCTPVTLRKGSTEGKFSAREGAGRAVTRAGLPELCRSSRKPGVWRMQEEGFQREAIRPACFRAKPPAGRNFGAFAGALSHLRSCAEGLTTPSLLVTHCAWYLFFC